MMTDLSSFDASVADAGRDRARAASREEVAERVRDAREAEATAQAAADRATTAANLAVNAVGAFKRQHAFRKGVAGEGVERAATAACERLRGAVADRAGALCSPEPADLTDLAALWFASQPGFSTALHEILDEGEGVPGLSPIDEPTYVQGVRELQAAAETARRAAAAASRRRTDVELRGAASDE